MTRTEEIAENLRRELLRDSSDEPYIEALKIIAGIPDRNGVTYASELHDVGSISRFAKRVLGYLG